ncbi:33238_t:CDS:1, partial [Gigaspora margarita]
AIGEPRISTPKSQAARAYNKICLKPYSQEAAKIITAYGLTEEIIAGDVIDQEK